MCGIIGVVSQLPVNQLIYDSLLLLQHRGQDAAGIATLNGNIFNMHKGNGMVRDVFCSNNMKNLIGSIGIGQVRYSTAGSYINEKEAQPFYVNTPFGITLAHNGNLTNLKKLKSEMFCLDKRHINTNSDTEVLLNVLANELESSVENKFKLNESIIFNAVSNVYKRIHGSYAIVALIVGYGLLAFRDPFGIRPLCIGKLETSKNISWMIASESVAIKGNGFKFVRNINPGEAIFINYNSKVYTKQCSLKSSLNPCIFEFIYLARADSDIDNVSVYNSRLKMGDYLSKKIISEISDSNIKIDAVMPVPDSARPIAMQVAENLNIKYREGFLKNRYIGRTFIMPEQTEREKSVQKKFNTIELEFKNKNILIIDDSIVRGTTAKEIIKIARKAGANKILFASASPPVKFQNVYGINMPTLNELISFNRSNKDVAKIINADILIYQDIISLKKSIYDINPMIKNLETSCFDGNYITGDITSSYLNSIKNTNITLEIKEKNKRKNQKISNNNQNYNQRYNQSLKYIA